jgi:signal transduction histidine kinase
MKQRLNQWLVRIDGWPQQIVILACILLVVFVGFLDYLTGYETFFFTFYLLAIFLGTWRVNAAFGAWISALSVTAWVSSNIEAGQHYSSYFVPVWNAGIMFAIYLIVVILLAGLKKIYRELEERVQLRTRALTREIQERVRLQKELLETGDREQRRIARELHDGLCQHLTGTALAGHLLEQKLAGKSVPEVADAARLVQLMEQAIEMTRDLSRQLEPVELAGGKLADHFAGLAAASAERFKIDCQFESALVHPFEDPEIALHLYRIAQEALMNAVKYNRATRLKIGLDSAADEIVLTITDDGAAQSEGIAADADADAAVRAMAYRADLIGAAFTYEPLAVRGHRVTCVLPLSPPGSKHAAQNQNSIGG